MKMKGGAEDAGQAGFMSTLPCFQESQRSCSGPLLRLLPDPVQPGRLRALSTSRGARGRGSPEGRASPAETPRLLHPVRQQSGGPHPAPASASLARLALKSEQINGAAPTQSAINAAMEPGAPKCSGYTSNKHVQRCSWVGRELNAAGCHVIADARDPGIYNTRSAFPVVR